MVAAVRMRRWEALGHKEKWAWRFRRFRPQMEEAQSPWGSFVILTVCDRKIPWEGLAQLSGAETALLFPKEVPLPPDFPAFIPPVDEAAFFWRATELLSALTCPMRGRRVLLPAKEKYTKWIERWIFYSQTFCLVGEETPGCQMEARRIMEEYGAAVLGLPQLLKTGGLLLDPMAKLAPWKGFGGLPFTAVSLRGRGICLEGSVGDWQPPDTVPIPPEEILAAFLAQGSLSPRELPIQGRQDGQIIPWERLVSLSEENCLIW